MTARNSDMEGTEFNCSVTATDLLRLDRKSDVEIEDAAELYRGKSRDIHVWELGNQVQWFPYDALATS